MLMKAHLEFHGLDLENGWETPAGYPPGFKLKVLSSDLDVVNKTGHLSRLVRIEPGSYTTNKFEHDYWEEILLIQGDLVVCNDEKGEGGEQFKAPTYAVRPPHVPHGPFSSRGGCLMFEINYYSASPAAGKPGGQADD